MIGVFDSGSGGLTVLKAIRDELPSCDVVYFGDIKNAPYGERTHEELSKLTIEAMRLLRERGATKIVSACNSVSASLALSVFDAFGIEPNDIIEMVGPTVAYLRNIEKKILLCATPATISSGIYQNAFTMVGKEIETLALPGVAGAIEFGASDEEIETLLEQAFATAPPFDVLVLACTHYPLRLDLFKKVIPDKTLIDPAIAVAERVYKKFWPQEVGDGKTEFLINQDSPQFRSLVERLFPGQAYSISVIK